MKRQSLLEAGLTENQNTEAVVKTTLAKDLKAIKKLKRDVEDRLEEAEEALEDRLSTNTPIDKSVVEVLFSKVKDLKAEQVLYKEFETEFLGE